MTDPTTFDPPPSGDAPGATERAGRGDLLAADSVVTGYQRSPVDVLRVVLWVLAAIVTAVLTRYLRDGMDGLEEDLTELVTLRADGLRLAIDLALVTMVVVATVVVLLIPLAMRRWRLLGYVLAANTVASMAMSAVNSWVGGLDPPVMELTGSAGDAAEALAVDVSAGATTAAQLVAAFIALGPFVTRKWRRAGLWLIGALIVLRVVVATGTSTHALLVLSVGSAVGTGVLLAFGRPTTRPRASAIVAALRSSGVPVASLEPAAVDARGSVPWFAELDDGSSVFVKVLGADERAADLMFRAYRMVRLRNVGDERPFSSLRRTVEHEALVALSARDAGVRTPRLRCVAAVGRDGFLLAYEMIDGRSLDRVDAEDLTDGVLRELWDQVAILRAHRIAHRDLRLANVFLSGEEPWLIDFGFSEVAADDAVLRTDVAHLLASLSVVVGTRRAVTAAVAALGTQAVADSLGRLQPAALAASTQSELKSHKGLLDDLRDEIARQCGVDEPELEPITRFTGRQVFTLVMLVAVVYFLVPQLADLPGILEQVRGAEWIWLLPILAASAATYLAAAVSIMGSVPRRIPPGPTAAAQVGSSFASKVAPAGLGGMALNVRYLQRQGVDGAVATSAVGLNAGAGIVGHFSLIAVFVWWAGSDAFGSITLPSPRAFLLGAGVVVAIALLAMAVPATRKLVIGKLLPILGTATTGLRDVLSSPGKLAMLFGGSTAVTFSYAVGFTFACRAFGVDERFVVLAAVYLVGAAVATAAPTPGGLGAVEAALVGGLVAVGVDNDVAVPAVFLYRLATFWLPILPGWLAFSWLRRTDRL